MYTYYRLHKENTKYFNNVSYLTLKFNIVYEMS